VKERDIEAGEILFREGEPSDSVYLILGGEVEVLRQAGDRRIRLGTRRAGQIVGEMGVIRGQPRSATIRVVSDAKVSRITKKQFLAAFGGKDQLALRILKMLCERLGDADRRIGEGALHEDGVRLDEVGEIRLLPGSPAVESQIGHDGLPVAALPFRVGRRVLPGEHTRIDAVELSLQAGETFHLAAQHFAIEGRDGQLVVRDLGSPLGTLVNDTRVAEFEEGLTAPLRFGANEIQAGGSESRYRFTLLVKRA
jgi:hypothetical protein